MRLLVSYRRDDRIVHAHFRDLPRFLEPGELIVVNDSGTLPAEVTARREDGTELPLRLSTHLPADLWTVEPREGGSHIGEVLNLPEGGSVTLIAPYSGSHRLWVARVDLQEPVTAYLLRWGRPIRYGYVPEAWPLEMYQTVYHGDLGSAEMPSAGRAFSCSLMEELERAGVGIARLTLHTGVSSLESDEPPYDELFRIPRETAEAVNAARHAGRRVISVGTTVVRALESAACGDGCVREMEGWTGVMITPERGVRVVDGLLTGFHEPRATHLAMLEAIAGRDHLRHAYRAALDGGYLWHEFGDLHLIL